MDLKQFIKESGNEYATIVEEGLAAGDVNSYIDTGSYLFNGLLSGSLSGGLPSNKITALAGESATGKTYFALGMVKQFLDTNPDGGVLYFESESAIPKELIESRGIDSKRMVILPVVTIQEFRTQSIKILDAYLETEQKPMMIVLDSLGNLSTTKELEDTAAGSETRDMTRAQIIKACFRVLTLKLGRANVPLVVTNHTYDVIGAYMPTKEMGGGSGLKYAASSIIYLSKKKDKEGTEVIGNIIHCKTQKSRLTVENKMIDVKLGYQSGIDRYYGLLEFGEKHGVFKRSGNRYEIDGKQLYGKVIYNEPEKYFDKKTMDKLEAAAKKEFLYGEVHQDIPESIPEE
jgi:RecA/RadA recombinase